MRLIGAVSIVYVLALAFAITGFPPAITTSRMASFSDDEAEQNYPEGQAIFRYDTFGDEQLWTCGADARSDCDGEQIGNVFRRIVQLRPFDEAPIEVTDDRSAVVTEDAKEQGVVVGDQLRHMGPVTHSDEVNAKIEQFLVRHG